MAESNLTRDQQEAVVRADGILQGISLAWAREGYEDWAVELDKVRRTLSNAFPFLEAKQD